MTIQAPAKPLAKWADFVSEVRDLHGHWIFRGDLEERSPEYPDLGIDSLETSLERACRSWKLPPQWAAEVERRLLREFQRHPEAHGLLEDATDNLGWFALMQHYGTPTRLVDWTYSPFVAAYFAFNALLEALPRDDSATSTKNTPSEPCKRARVWALNTDWLTRAVKAMLSPTDWELYQKKDSASFVALFVERSPRVPFVGAVNPLHLNDRLSLQQGLFLCPGDVCQSFAENMRALGCDSDPAALRSFVMNSAVMHEAFEDLWQMNVSARSLFPGLGGYARSMLHRLRSLWEDPIA